MSGIAGIYAEQFADERLAQAMIKQLGHRGPSGPALLGEGRVVCAQARGPDASDDALPLRSLDGSLLLVADGMIDNAAELRAHLEARGHRHYGDSDWELLLSAYTEYGEDLPRHIDGVYVFALYDRIARKLLLVRDRLGVRPLFLARTGNGWAFASELKGLLPALGAPAIDPRALAQFLQGRFSAGRHTLLAGTTRVQAGELVILNEHGEIDQRSYWTLAETTSTRIKASEANARFDRLARETLSAHVSAESMLLCDGEQSTQLLALMAAHGTMPAATVGFPGDNAAAKLAAHFGIPHHIIGTKEDMSAEGLARQFALHVWAADDLIFDHAAPARLLAAESIGKERNQLLAAIGSAEIFASAARYRRGFLQGLIARLFEPDIADLTKGVFQGQERALFGPALHRAAPEWRAPYTQALAAYANNLSELQRRQCLDLTVTLPERTLASFDRTVNAQGGTWRAPWMDRRLVEFGFALPDRIKTARISLPQRHARALLPANLVHARVPLLPLRTWLSGETLERAGRVLSASPPLRAWLHKDALSGIIDAARAGRPASTLRLALILQFALWHRIFIEGDGTRPEAGDPVKLLED
ncbi:MAG: asparagine synthetase B [Chromatiales bacterium]|jgi:asparagine synthase (glutamine-hydrolysing)|nr:asparagine synthetase B [Chromatiales bacterium]